MLGCVCGHKCGGQGLNYPWGSAFPSYHVCFGDKAQSLRPEARLELSHLTSLSVKICDNWGVMVCSYNLRTQEDKAGSGVVGRWRAAWAT